MKSSIILVLTIGCAVNTFAQQTLHRFGTVRYPNGEPAAGVQMTFYPGSYSSDDDYNYREAITDTNGWYEILPPKKVSGFVWGPNISTNSIMARDFEKNLAAVQAFSVTTTNVNLTLQPAITLSGSVKNTEGAPVSGAEINLGFVSERYAPEMRPPFKANEQGQFSIPALPQGIEYWISGITAKGYGSSHAIVKAKDTQTNHCEFPTFVLKHADRILAGQVLDSDGKPVAGAEVDFRGDGQPQNSTTKTDSEGKFFSDTVCEGVVRVSAVLWGPPFMSDGGGAGTPVQAGDTNVVINLRDPNGNRIRTPLHDAAQQGDLETVKALLKKNPDLVSSKGTNSYGSTPLRGGTPLHMAARNGDYNMVALLLASNAVVNAKDNDGVAPLHEVAIGGDKDVAELLLLYGAEINTRANNGFTPLHWAALYGHRELAEVLLANGAEVNAMNNNGQTPLHWAIANGRKTVAELLRQHGGLENGYEVGRPAGATTNWDAAAMRGAIQSGDLKAVEALLKENPALIFSKDDQSRTPLILAAFQGKKDVAALLLASKSDIKARDIFGRMALHWAAQRGFKDVVELLLANHAEIEARDNNGNTPLFLAADLGRKDVAELLVANKADVNATNNIGWTPLHSLMTQQQKDPPAGTGTPTQALHAAILQRQKGVVEVLRQHGGHE